MLGIDFTGRLGNQMFTYAFARLLIEMSKDTDVVANFKRSAVGGESDGFTDSLRFFNVIPYVTDNRDLVLKYGTLMQRLLYCVYVLSTKFPVIGRNDRFLSAVERRLKGLGLYFTGAADDAVQIDKLPSAPLFVRGYFQHPGNFDSIRQILLREFTPKLPPLESNKELYAVAARENSVCVSVRRGDYLSEQYRRDFYVCTPEYFQRAIEKMRGFIENPTFIFFSNDIEWLRENIRVADCECYYESGADPVWETLRLMYSCHHFIISNSTFAWWAQYLGRRNDKRVIGPSRWYANEKWSSHLPNTFSNCEEM